MSKKINPVNRVEIDPMFDGHIEKPLSEMTPKEKLDYLWMQTVFKWKVRTKVEKVNEEKVNNNQNH